MPYYAVVRGTTVLYALGLADAVEAALQEFEEAGDFIVEMPEEDYLAFEISRLGEYADGVFDIPPPPVVNDIPLDAAKIAAINNLAVDYFDCLETAGYPNATIEIFKKLAHVCEIKMHSGSDPLGEYEDRYILIKSVFNWIELVLSYVYEKEREINQCEDIESVTVITWDFSQFDASDPGVTLASVDL